MSHDTSIGLSAAGDHNTSFAERAWNGRFLYNLPFSQRETVWQQRHYVGHSASASRARSRPSFR
jgi:hypothetical protein